MQPLRTLAAFAAGLALLAPAADATTVDFEDVGQNLPIANPDTGEPEFFYSGFSAARAGEPTDFTSGGAILKNDFTDFGDGCCGQGWFYSQTTDTTTPGFGNQYSAITGGGVGGSDTYGVAFTGGGVGAQEGVARITLPGAAQVEGAWFTNTTFAALSMRDGDAFAKQFGGPTGTDPDFFILSVIGRDADGLVTGSVDFALADYRFADDTLDYIVMEWTWVDLTPLGEVAKLDFVLDSSDTAFGFLNTPAYLAMDELVYVPEPGIGALLGLGFVGLLGRRRRGRLACAAAVLGAAGAASAGPFTEAGYDPSLMAAWATDVDDFARGPVDIAMPELGDASFGVPENALGPATGSPFDVFSLGDGGYITLSFETGIGNGPGDDFAVYENGFFAPGGLFAELAFVEVSSNGIDFARFEATSLRATPVPDGGVVDPTDYHYLAGKHAAGLGTGFDLADLSQHPLVTGGDLILHDVRFVRLVDVIGDGSTTDAFGNPVYDPYSTPYGTGGFDAEAVGVLHEAPEPGSLQMLLAGTGCLYVLSRRRVRTPRCARRS